MLTTSRPFRALALNLAVVVSLAASCAREEGPEGVEPSGDEGGKSAQAGKSAASGSPSKAGSMNGFGGTSSTAGASSGGKSSTAGSGSSGEAATGGSAGSASGGKAGAGGTGGAGGSGGVPQDVLDRASVIVQYKTSEATASTKNIQMNLNIVNQSTDPLPMASVKIRYWFTAEATPELHQYYVHASLTGPKAVFVADGENSHALLTFGGGQVVKGADISQSEIQLNASSNTASFDQANDFSWLPTATKSTPNPKVTLYLDDVLIWGCEPSGKCFDDGTGSGGAGAGGADGGEPGGAGGAP